MSGQHYTARRQRLVRALHQLGEQPLFYILREAEAEFGIDLTARLEEYAVLPADFIAAYGTDRFPPRLHALSDEGAA
jgi:hypothetical protein